MVLLAALFIAPAAPGAAGRTAPSEPPPGVAEGGIVDDREIHLVFLSEAPLAAYRGGVPGLAPTNAEVNRTRRLDPKAPASRAYLAWLERRQEAHRARIRAALGRQPQEVFRYRAAGNGFALRLTPAEAVRVARLPGVTAVVPDRLETLLTDRGPELVGAALVWSAAGLAGEGIVVGILDTGANNGHPSFSEAPSDGHTFTNPLGAGVFLGWCDPANPNYDPRYRCNDKLIGAWDFVDAISPESDGADDDHGHGSHTASTAVGNRVDYNGDGVPDVSGVAPHANLVIYDVCYVDPFTLLGVCPFSATSAAVDQAVLDGVVDVLSFSITGGTDPWNAGSIDRFFLNAVDAGIFVAASAGNSGPSNATVLHRGPWVTTVAATTHDRVAFEARLLDLSGGASPPPAVVGRSRSGTYGPASMVWAGDYDNSDSEPQQCLRPFPPGTWSGEIVVCERGSIPRVMKAQNIGIGGAGGMVLANVQGSETNLVDDAHVLPSVHVDRATGEALKSWLAQGSGHLATISAPERILDPSLGDRVTDFSSRGPNLAADVLKPDIGAPGLSIFAAGREGQFDAPALPHYVGPKFTTMSGTSMASPHVGGAAALIVQANPDWSPTEIKSALLTTAQNPLLLQDGIAGADPHDMGMGRIDVSRAGRAGLVLDESGANFLAADPAAGGDPQTLNLPTMVDSQSGVSSNWVRTVRGAWPDSVTWTVSTDSPNWMPITVQPSSFLLPAGGSQSLAIEVRQHGAVHGFWGFGKITLTPDDPGIPVAQFGVGVVPIPAPELVPVALRLDDSDLGNGDGILDPTEVITLEVDLRNDGSVGASGVTGTLSSPTPGITVVSTGAAWGSIDIGATVPPQPPHLRVQIGEEVPCGSTFDLDLDVESDQGSFRFSHALRVGDEAGQCSTISCLVSASASATPASLCLGESAVLSADGSQQAGVGCSDLLEYRIEEGGQVLQDWSPDPDRIIAPQSTATYTVRARDPATLIEDETSITVPVGIASTTAVAQDPPVACSELGTVRLDANQGLLLYRWTDEAGTVVGGTRSLQLGAPESCGRTFTVEVAGGNGCTSQTSHVVACAPCSPPEVSAPGSPVPFRMGLDEQETIEFELLPDPSYTYSLWVAETLAGMLAGEFTHKICHLEVTPYGTWNPIAPDRVQWTPIDPSLLTEGLWIVLAEDPILGLEGSYGNFSDGTPRPKDLNGVGTGGDVLCEGPFD